MAQARSRPPRSGTRREDASKESAALSGFESWLHERGSTSTEQRRRVLREILRSPPHFDAEGLEAHMRSSGSRVSRATLYRTLARLEAAGLLRRVELAQGHAHFELQSPSEHHEHLVCDRCGSVIEFDDTALEERLAAVTRSRGFRPRHHLVQVFGTCASCARDAE